MKNSIGRTVLLCILGTTILAIVISVAGQRRLRRERRCTGVVVTVKDSAMNKFVTRNEVRRFVDLEWGGCVNRYCDSVHLGKIENILSTHGCLATQQAYFTPDGILHIDVTQCSPKLKVKKGGTVLYVDSRGNAFQVREDWCEGLVKIEGPALECGSKYLAAVAAVADWVEQNPQWKEKVCLYRCVAGGQLTVRLDGRDEEFIFGSPTATGEKFGRISEYLEKVAPAAQAQGIAYKSVNVKYSGQLVCR